MYTVRVGALHMCLMCDTSVHAKSVCFEACLRSCFQSGFQSIQSYYCVYLWAIFFFLWDHELEILLHESKVKYCQPCLQAMARKCSRKRVFWECFSSCWALEGLTQLTLLITQTYVTVPAWAEQESLGVEAVAHSVGARHTHTAHLLQEGMHHHGDCTCISQQAKIGRVTHDVRSSVIPSLLENESWQGECCVSVQWLASDRWSPGAVRRTNDSFIRMCHWQVMNAALSKSYLEQDED